MTIENENHILMGLDYGGSLTKGFYKVKSKNELSLLAMEADIATLSHSTVETYEIDRLGTPLPENCTWVSINNKESEEYKAVGFLAQRFNGEPGLNELKYERAVYKTLAAIWVSYQRLKLKGNKLRLSLCCVLPSGEYKDKDRFEKKLKTALRDFGTPSGRLSVELTKFMCRPEGAGIHMLYERSNSHKVLTSNIYVLMLGFRNVSILSSHRGNIEPSHNSDFGFIKMIEAMSHKVSGLNIQQAPSVIASAGYPVDQQKLKSLVRSRSEKGKKEDLQILYEGLLSAQKDYLSNLLAWLDNYIYSPKGKGAEVILIAGGTGEYFLLEISRRYGELEVHSSSNFSKVPNLVGKKGFSSRYDDIYGLFTYFLAKVK